MRARRFALLAALAGTAACTAIAGLDGEFVGDETTATPTDDAGTKSDSAPGHDGQVGTDDAPMTVDEAGDDGGTGADVDADAAVEDLADAHYPSAWARDANARDAATPLPSSGPKTKYCNPNTDGVGQFCWDFTDDDALSFWSLKTTGGTVTLAGDAAAGDPFRAGVMTVNGASTRIASLYRTIHVADIPDHAAGINVSFTVKLGNVQADANVAGVEIGGAFYGLAVYKQGCFGQPCMGESTHGVETDVAHRRPFDPDAWYRVYIHLSPVSVPADRDAGPLDWKGRIEIGDTVIADSTAPIPQSGNFPDAIDIYVGLRDSPAPGTDEVTIDDFFVF